MDKIIEAIEGWRPLTDGLAWPDARFTELARRVFAHQFANNEAYRRFCDRRGVDPGRIDGYRQVPAAPTDVFKHVRLTTADRPVRTFRTSGTTVGERGEHHFGTLAAYRAALVGPFVRFCLPDLEALADDQIRMLVVAPSGRHLPDSSLSFMLDELLDRFGDPASGYFVNRGDDGQLHMAFDELEAALDRAQSDGVATMMLGTAFGWVEFFESTDRHWQLAAGSRVMETGGFKGKSRRVSRADLYEMFETVFDVPQSHCVGEYSMTELSSQAYTDRLYAAVQQDGAARVDPGERVLQTPPWARVDIVDPLSFEPIDEPGVEGLIRWYDLANVDSVLAVQTSDLGVRVDGGGFRLLGRAPRAQLRGCSLTIEEIVDASP